jgi:predicted dehydrogenase
MKTIRFGILGPGYIAPRFVEAVSLANYAQVIAVASKTPNKASDFAHKHSIPYSFTTYEELLSNEEVDIVYISTRHADHKQHIMLALNNHKHVLVEKPMVLNESDAKECFDRAASLNLFLMEAQKMIFLPLIQAIKKRIAHGDIGTLKLIETSFSYADRFDHGHWMISYAHGGGLYGTASYGLQFSNFFSNSSVKTISALASLYENNADRYGVATLLYENGVLAHTRFGTDVETRNKAFLYGSKGYIEIDLFWKNDFAKLHIPHKETEDILIETTNDMVYEVNHVVECLQHKLTSSPIMTPAFSIETARVLEVIKHQITNNEEKS